METHKLTSAYANSEDIYEMPHNVAFHLGVHFCYDKSNFHGQIFGNNSL